MGLLRTGLSVLRLKMPLLRGLSAAGKVALWRTKVPLWREKVPELRGEACGESPFSFGLFSLGLVTPSSSLAGLLSVPVLSLLRAFFSEDIVKEYRQEGGLKNVNSAVLLVLGGVWR